jgi:hypothetical protein
MYARFLGTLSRFLKAYLSFLELTFNKSLVRPSSTTSCALLLVYNMMENVCCRHESVTILVYLTMWPTKEYSEPVVKHPGGA